MSQIIQLTWFFVFLIKNNPQPNVTACPRSFDPFHLVTLYIKLIKSSSTPIQCTMCRKPYRFPSRVRPDPPSSGTDQLGQFRSFFCASVWRIRFGSGFQHLVGSGPGLNIFCSISKPKVKHRIDISIILPFIQKEKITG